MSSRTLVCFRDFVARLREVWAAAPDDRVRMQQAQAILARLLGEPELLASSRQWPWTVGQNLLLYEDADYGFVINATVRPPGSRGTVHDHAHAWTLYGILDGAEQLERYERIDDGRVEGRAELRLISDATIDRGQIDVVAPHEIHAERGGPGRSVAVIIRSERLVGRVRQLGFDVETGTVREIWGPTQIPYELASITG